ncbi:MAG: DUF669 domain-containing protein [Acutalibacteraceae bacterium]
MGFKANQAEASQGSNIKPEGDYECIISRWTEKDSKSGSKGLNFAFIVRNDVEQAYKNAYIWHTLWKHKKPTEADMQVNGYGFGQIMAMGKAAGLPDGKEYESLEEFCNDLINKPIRVTLRHEEYNGKIQERVSYVNPSKFPQCNHIPKQSSTTAENSYASKPQQFAVNTAAKPQQFANDTGMQMGFTDMPIIADDDLPF